MAMGRMGRGRARPLVFAAVVWSTSTTVTGRKAARVKADQTVVLRFPGTSPSLATATNEAPIRLPMVAEAPLRSPRVLVRADPVAPDRSDCTGDCTSCSRRSDAARSIHPRRAARLRAFSMMLLSQQMKILIGGHRSNKSDRRAFGCRLRLFHGATIKTRRTSRALRLPMTKLASDARRARQAPRYARRTRATTTPITTITTASHIKR